jgi:hypothetical protein
VGRIKNLDMSPEHLPRIFIVVGGPFEKLASRQSECAVMVLRQPDINLIT